MKTTITNLSPRSRDKTAIVTFPSGRAANYPDESTFEADAGFKFRAVRTGKRGVNTDVFRVLTSMEGDERLSGDIIPEAHATANTPYKYHKWVADDIAATIPDVGVVELGAPANSIEWSSNADIQVIEMVEQSPVHQRWFLRKVIPNTGLVFEWWADINHDDPVIQFWGKIIWSDMTDPNGTKMFGHFKLKCGEYPVLDFGKIVGAGAPQKIGGKWEMLLGSNIEMRDGGGIPLAGSLLAFVGPARTPVDPEPSEDAKDFDSLLAALQGPVYGVSHSWNGDWLANKWVPRRSDVSQMYADGNEEWLRFKSSMANTVGWGENTMVGIQKNPGMTGDQEDFGATKGIYAVRTKDPRHIQLYQHSVYNDVYRGFMHYDVEDGKHVPLKLENHPNWVTWSTGTHWNTSVSTDRLGKTEFNPFGDIWWGYDDQHRSQNNLAAYIQLTDDPLAMDIINHITTVDMAGYRLKYPVYGGAGAARAQGRMAGCLANFYTLVDEGKVKEDIRTHLQVKWDGISNNPQMNVAGPVKVIGYNAPDGRKPIFDPQGNLLPTWSVWEHGLALVGLYNAHKANPSPQTHEVLTTVFTTLAEQGCFEANDGWWLVADQWLREGGEPIPGVLSKDNVYLDYGRGGVCGWVKAAMFAAAEFLPAGAAKEKATACSRFFSNGQDTTSPWEDEWWCVVESQDM